MSKQYQELRFGISVHCFKMTVKSCGVSRYNADEQTSEILC